MFFIFTKTRNNEEMKTFRLNVDVPKFHSCTIYNVHSNSRNRNSSASRQFICEITFLIQSLSVSFWPGFEMRIVYGVKSCGAQLFCRRWSSARRLAPYRGSPSIILTGSFFVYRSDHLDIQVHGPLRTEFLIWDEPTVHFPFSSKLKFRHVYVFRCFVVLLVYFLM